MKESFSRDILYVIHSLYRAVKIYNACTVSGAALITLTNHVEERK